MYGRTKRLSYLFRGGNVFDAIQSRIGAASAEVEALPEQRILNTDPDTLTAYFVDKFGVAIPTIDRSSLSLTHHERNVTVRDEWRRDRQISVPGEAYDFELQFEGDPEFFNLQPSTYDTGPPDGVLNGHTITRTIEDRALPAERVKREVDSWLDSIERYLNWHRQSWATYPQTLSSSVRQRIDARRERLLRQKGSAAELASMGIRLREKPGDARTFVAPTIKQRVTPQLPPMRPAATPDPTLAQEQYETILALIRGAGRSIEQSSSRTRQHDEETLRDIFLVPLNAHFGAATGEAFNYQGKTDILIRSDGGNLFVAEFKIWKGDKQFLAAIDQLLSYLTWRDTKTALVILSRNAGFTEVIAKARDLTQSHASFVRGPVKLDESSYSFTFALPQDRERHVTVTVLLFDLGNG